MVRAGDEKSQWAAVNVRSAVQGWLGPCAGHGNAGLHCWRAVGRGWLAHRDGLLVQPLVASGSLQIMGRQGTLSERLGAATKGVQLLGACGSMGGCTTLQAGHPAEEPWQAHLHGRGAGLHAGAAGAGRQAGAGQACRTRKERRQAAKHAASVSWLEGRRRRHRSDGWRAAWHARAVTLSAARKAPPFRQDCTQRPQCAAPLRPAQQRPDDVGDLRAPRNPPFTLERAACILLVCL
jgi:hypothetical protein